MTLTNITNVSDAAFSANNPGELDYLRPNSFKFMVHNIPNVSYFCQAANIPEINIALMTPERIANKPPSKVKITVVIHPNPFE